MKPFRIIVLVAGIYLCLKILGVWVREAAHMGSAMTPGDVVTALLMIGGLGGLLVWFHYLLLRTPKGQAATRSRLRMLTILGGGLSCLILAAIIRKVGPRIVVSLWDGPLPGRDGVLDPAFLRYAGQAASLQALVVTGLSFVYPVCLLYLAFSARRSDSSDPKAASAATVHERPTLQP